MVEKRKIWMVSGEREREREGKYVRDGRRVRILLKLNKLLNNIK
jgi:hypothetical protein